jgi:co-chaperonin GroES (HSP10)|tara:strand:+ start:1212 stop:1628 length:417 start_codon:yes stop_codon:yes gene_type:complete
MKMTEMTALEMKRKEKIEKQTQEEIVLENQIPKPVGYRVLVALPGIDENFGEGSIAKATQTMREEYILSMVGAVIDMGDQAYTDEARFPTGPWCKVGDYVMFRTNTGTRFRVGQQEYRMMNDDSIEAIVDDPGAISRA